MVLDLIMHNMLRDDTATYADLRNRDIIHHAENALGL